MNTNVFLLVDWVKEHPGDYANTVEMAGSLFVFGGLGTILKGRLCSN